MSPPRRLVSAAAAPNQFDQPAPFLIVADVQVAVGVCPYCVAAGPTDVHLGQYFAIHVKHGQEGVQLHHVGDAVRVDVDVARAR